MPIIRRYIRSDGTPVREHFRWPAGARREVTILAGFALAVVIIGNSNAQTANGESPRPGPGAPVTYPVRLDQSADRAPGAAVPRPTVSYPIKWASGTKPPAPRPTVPYPVDFSTMGTGR